MFRVLGVYNFAWGTNSYQNISDKSNHIKNIGKDFTKIVGYVTGYTPTDNTMKNRLSIHYWDIRDSKLSTV
jgi:hypothetical protein